MNKQQFTDIVKSAIRQEQFIVMTRPDNSAIKRQAYTENYWINGDIKITYTSTVCIGKDGSEHASLNLNKYFGFIIQGVEVEDWMYGVCSDVLNVAFHCFGRIPETPLLVFPIVGTVDRPRGLVE